MSDTPAAKTAKSASAKASQTINETFDVFSMAKPGLDLPPVFREMAEKAVESTKDSYAQLKAAGEQAAEALEDSYSATRTGMLDFGSKSLDAAQAHSEATFAFFRDLMSVKSLSEAMTLQTNFARAQFETLTAEAKDFGTFSQKLATDAVRPLQANVEKAMSGFKPH